MKVLDSMMNDYIQVERSLRAHQLRISIKSMNKI